MTTLNLAHPSNDDIFDADAVAADRHVDTFVNTFVDLMDFDAMARATSTRAVRDYGLFQRPDQHAF